jgi:hypothetical protein
VVIMATLRAMFRADKANCIGGFPRFFKLVDHDPWGPIQGRFAQVSVCIGTQLLHSGQIERNCACSGGHRAGQTLKRMRQAAILAAVLVDPAIWPE